MRRPLLPSEMYPAGVAGVSARMCALANGARIRVLEAGPGDGTPIVMLHGWGASAYMFRHALALLPSQGFRVVAVDLRGFGLSDKPIDVDSYSLNSYCADLDRLLDQLSPHPVTLVGQSMGGGVALHYALSRPIRLTKLVLINPIGLVDVRGVNILGALPAPLVEAFGAQLGRIWVGVILRHIAYGDAALVTERDIDEYWSPTCLPGFIHAAHSALRSFDWRPMTDAQAASLAVPTLVILGTRDRLVHNTTESALRLRGATVESVPGGHCAPEEHPELVYPMIVQWSLALPG